MKKAIPVRMPPWPESLWPTTRQVENYILRWKREQRPLARDPGIGAGGQASFWLNPQLLDENARIVGCLRAGRPERALFVRRILATYHLISAAGSKGSLPIAMPKPPGAPAIPFTAPLPAPARAKSVSREESPLSPTEVNQLSRRYGLGICWQPGNSYRLGRTTLGKSCLIQFDGKGMELSRYGSW